VSERFSAGTGKDFGGSAYISEYEEVLKCLSAQRANWKMSAPTLVRCSKCGALMMPHRVCKNCGTYNKKQIIKMDEA
jgi:large subunit ribosomal protein L32